MNISKNSEIIYILAAAIHFMNHDMPLFSISVGYYRVKYMDELYASWRIIKRGTARQMECDEKILVYIDCDIDES